LDWTIIVVIAAAAAFGFGWLANRRPRSASPSQDARVERPVTAEAPEPASSIADQLQALSPTLEAQAENTTHPRDLLDFADFKRAVELFADPACELEVARRYALGRLWVLSCAAFEALRGRADRAEMLEAAIAQLRGYSPGTLHYVLRYFASLEARPPPGLAVTLAQRWWATHSMLTETFRDDFAARAALGDPPVFGDAISRPDLDWEAMEMFLAAVDHPFAVALARDLKLQLAGRVDEKALAEFGRFWRGGDAKALVEPAPWREALDRCERALLAAPPRSILVVGGPRMGKSSFLKLLAARVADAGWRVFEATAAELMSDQMYIGQIEGRVRRTVAELAAGKRVAWCVGDLAQLARSGTHQGQAASLLDQIWPAVAGGRLVLLAEASADGASRTLQMRPSLAMHLEVVRLAPFDEEELAAFAGGVAERLQTAHAAPVEAAARDEAVHFALQYLGAAEAPGVVADVLRRAVERAAQSEAQGEGTSAGPVGPRHVVEAVSQMTGLPVDILDDDKPVDLAAVRAFFAARVIGQDDAIATVVDRIAMLKAGLVDTTKPIGVFLFAGPTGTGKTELAKTLAAFLFGSPERLARLDMSEFQAPDSVGKIVGERGGGNGVDSLVERIRKQPFSVVLLDEFEKAHANIWDLFLQVFDDGRLTDANGRTVDLRHTIIILTSNLGASSHRSAGMGFSRANDVFTEHQVLNAVARTFRPEFVNRLDRIVVFKPLSRELMYQILRKELAGVLDRRGLKSREWAVEWEPSALDFLIDQGFSPEMGARPLKRAIDHHLLAPLAATLVEHRFPKGDQFLFVRSNGKAIEVEFLDPDPAADPTPVDAPAPSEFTVPDLVLRPQGGPEAIAFLHAGVRALQARLDGEAWRRLKARFASEAADPEIWERADRARVFSAVNLIDRVQEAARTLERLGGRLTSGGAHAGAKGDAAASRELAGRVALQLALTQAGVADVFSGAPADVVLSLDPTLDGDGAGGSLAWRERLFAMYLAWAERRRMQFSVVEGPKGGPPLFLVSGFGAWRTLAGEAGLHVLEHPPGSGRRRETVRVRAAAGPDEEVPAGRLHAALSARVAQAPMDSHVRRRYREAPSPLVRDTASGQRSGHLDLVLAGDFDLVFAPAETATDAHAAQ
jgi:ATP-dependent Clp protease ATP-binding subunit ClpC